MRRKGPGRRITRTRRGRTKTSPDQTSANPPNHPDEGINKQLRLCCASCLFAQVKFGQHPEEVTIPLHPTTTLIWTTALLHATEIQRGPGPRRVLEFRFRDAADPTNQGESRGLADAVPLVFPRWEQEWGEARQRLWGLRQAGAAAAL